MTKPTHTTDSEEDKKSPSTSPQSEEEVCMPDTLRMELERYYEVWCMNRNTMFSHSLDFPGGQTDLELLLILEKNTKRQSNEPPMEL